MKKPSKQQIKISSYMLIFTCMTEVLFSSYDKVRLAIGFDANLLNKLSNMKAQLDLILKNNANFIDSTGEESIKLYHSMTSVFEGVFEAAEKGDSNYLVNFLDLITAYHDNDIQAVDEKDYNSLIEENERLKKEIEELKK